MIAWHPLPSSLHSLVAECPNSVLLQTARFDSTNQHSYLYLNPLRILYANALIELPQLFAAVEAALADGHFIAGYFHYECGYHFEPRALPPHLEFSNRTPLAWFGVFAEPVTFDHATGQFSQTPPSPSLDDPGSNEAFVEAITLNINEARYKQQILKIKDLIAAGDTYQVNFTDSLTLDTLLFPGAAFTALLRQQPVSYGALLNIAGQHILSLSPELFFHLNGDTILTRPMKGTIARGLDLAEDALAASTLQHDAKNRSEHVMIVDLLRNDLGRICTAGSVHVPDLFTIERYETLHQMTSTVAGTLLPSQTCYDIFRALFPSGSITGAPKIRTMQIIADLEARSRGIYTGAIGHITPARDGRPRNATFNVAIRTLTLEAGGQATMGVGGGIVADSEPAAEYRECLLKTSFLTRSRHDFQLIETMLYNASGVAGGDVYLLQLHLDRLAASAEYFNFSCDLATIRDQLKAFTHSIIEAPQFRIRLLLRSDGQATLTSTPFIPATPAGLVRIAEERTLSTDVFLRHKTTRRTLYDQHYQKAVAEGFDEALFFNERNELTEGAISNVFLSFSGKLLTPPLSSGVLPGIYRRYLLETHSAAEEMVLTLEDLHRADAIYICNSIRGINEVKLHSSIRASR